MPVIKLKTPAKINLFLSILKKGLNNYHEIETIFQAINLFDFITIDYRESGNQVIKIKSDSDEVPTDSTNLVYKAAEKFLEAANIKADLTIKINKNIPVAAGLAGGSSDAACVLIALNKLNNYPLKEKVIRRIAVALGADVNFFMDSGTSVGKGIGDILKPLITPELDIVLLKPKNLITKSGWAYEKYDQLSIKPSSRKITDMIQAIEKNNHEDISNLLFNSLEFAVFKEYPELRKYKEMLIKAGCTNAMLSGSGPTIFGLARDEVHAQEIKSSLETEELELWAVKSRASTLNKT